MPHLTSCIFPPPSPVGATSPPAASPLPICCRLSDHFPSTGGAGVEYCEQADRRDGLSGSVSNDGAEIGWASAYDPLRFIPGKQPKGVVYGSDRPPALPLPELAPTLRKAVTGGARPNGGPASVEALGGVRPRD